MRGSQSKLSGNQSTINYAVGGDPPGTTYDYVLDREYVYGLEYIDEQVAQLVPNGTTSPSVRYVLQDANYNVVGIVRECDKTIIQQYAYKPYGEFLAVEDATGADVDLATNPTALITHQLFQGLKFNQETGQYVAGNRILNPPLGRFNQRDPLLVKSTSNATDDLIGLSARKPCPYDILNDSMLERFADAKHLIVSI